MQDIMSECKVGNNVDMKENLKWNTDLIETMELEHVMSQAPQDLDDGETRHDDGKLKLTNVTKCSGRSTHQGATRKLNSQTSRVEEVCSKNACMNKVHMTCPPPPTQCNLKGWRSALDAILPEHQKHPSGSWQGHPRYTGAWVTGRPWVARHQHHIWQSQDAMTHHPDSPTTNQLVQKTVEVPQKQIKKTDTNVNTKLSAVVNYRAKL